MTAALDAPDLERCQAEVVTRTPFALGGTHKRARCDNPPTMLATEAEAGDDGQRGQMALCAQCAAILVRLEPGRAVLEPLA